MTRRRLLIADPPSAATCAAYGFAPTLLGAWYVDELVQRRGRGQLETWRCIARGRGPVPPPWRELPMYRWANGAGWRHVRRRE